MKKEEKEKIEGKSHLLKKLLIQFLPFCIYSMKNLVCEEGESKSPAFFSAMNFSQKSPGFNLFDSSLFGAQNSSDEVKIINCEH